MTLASLFRPAPAVPSGGRHVAPDTGEDHVVAVLDTRPGRHAALEDDAADPVTEESGDLLDALGFAYDD